MAAPTLVSSTGNIFTTANSTTFAPAFGFTANAGDTIVVHVCEDGSGGTNVHTWSGSWVRLFTNDDATTTHSAGYLQAAGGETGVATITATGAATSDHWAALIWRFTGAGTPEATRTNGSSATPDPPNHTPSGGSNDYFWIAGYAVDTGATQRTNTADPAGYTNLIESREVSTTGAQCRGGSRTNTAASEDPGSFTLNGTETWQSFTISVPPAAAAAVLNTRLLLGVGT